MIIKLTEIRNSTARDGSKKPELHAIYINANQIQSFAKSINGNDTRIQLQGTGYLFVKESCEEILDSLVPKPIVAILPDDMDHAYGADARIIYGVR